MIIFNPLYIMAKSFTCSPRGILIPIRDNTGDLPIGELYYDREIYTIESTDPTYSHISVRSGISPQSPPGWVVINKSTNTDTKYIIITCGKPRVINPSPPITKSKDAPEVVSNQGLLNSDINISAPTFSDGSLVKADLGEVATRTNRPDEITKVADPNKPWANPLSWTVPTNPAAYRVSDNKPIEPVKDPNIQQWKYIKNTNAGKGPSSVDPALYWKVDGRGDDKKLTSHQSELSDKEIVKESFISDDSDNYIVYLFIILVIVLSCTTYYYRSSIEDLLNKFFGVKN